jgi:hypothetical protein
VWLVEREALRDMPLPEFRQVGEGAVAVGDRGRVEQLAMSRSVQGLCAAQ